MKYSLLFIAHIGAPADWGRWGEVRLQYDKHLLYARQIEQRNASHRTMRPRMLFKSRLIWVADVLPVASGSPAADLSRHKELQASINLCCCWVWSNRVAKKPSWHYSDIAASWSNSTERRV